MNKLPGNRPYKLVGSAVIIVVAGVLLLFHVHFGPKIPTPSQTATPSPRASVSTADYQACTSAPGAKIEETYPEQCVTSDGRTLTNPDQH